MINLKHSVKVFGLAFLIVVPAFAMNNQPSSTNHIFTESVDISGQISVPHLSKDTHYHDYSGATINSGDTIHTAPASAPRAPESFIAGLRKSITNGYEREISGLIVKYSLALALETATRAAVYGYNKFFVKNAPQDRDLAAKLSMEQELSKEMNKLHFQASVISTLEKQIEEREAQEKLKPLSAQGAAQALQRKDQSLKNIEALRMALWQKIEEASSRVRAEYVPTAEVAA